MGLKKIAKNLILFLPAITSIFLCSISFIITKKDTFFNFRWISFVLWLLSFLIIFIFSFKKFKFSFWINKEEKFLVFFILLISGILNFLLLKKYPFVAVMDEIRDGGLNARQILEGEIKNIFGYGRYESHGLVIPTLIIPFYLIFKNSVFTYRLPSAMIAIIDILIIWLLAKRIMSSKGAFFSSLILAILPLHLYYARTEIVVMFSSLFTSIILLSLYNFLKNKDFWSFIFLGSILGFSSGLHASVRTIVFMSFFPILISIFYWFLKEKNKIKIIFNFLGLILFFFIGFGPRLLFTKSDIFFHLRTAAIFKNENAEWEDTNISLTNLYENRQLLKTNYLKSLKGYFYEPVSLHFQDKRPILPKGIALFLIFGIISAIFLKRKLFYWLIVIFFFLIPFTNSAITDCVNCDHRWLPTLPICALLSGLGIDAVSDRLKKVKIKKWTQTIFLGSILIYLFSQSYIFFVNESASKGKSSQDYLSMHLVYFLQSLKPKNICLSMSPDNYQFFNLLHIKEQYDFFLPKVEIKKQIEPFLPENIVYVTKDCNISTKKVLLYKQCSKKIKYICPLDYEGNFKIYVEKDFVR